MGCCPGARRAGAPSEHPPPGQLPVPVPGADGAPVIWPPGRTRHGTTVKAGRRPSRKVRTCQAQASVHRAPSAEATPSFGCPRAAGRARDDPGHLPPATGEPHPPTSAVTHSAANLDVVAWLYAFAGQRGIALPRLAVAWAVNVAIAGARRASPLKGCDRLC